MLLGLVMHSLIRDRKLAKSEAKTLHFSEILKLKGLKGVYTLVILVRSTFPLKIGGLGERLIKRGIYTYTGSALGRGSTNLAGRIFRHLRMNKRRKWHIDYLLCSGKASIEAALILVTEERMECNVNQHLIKNLNPTIPIPNFGSSDCNMGCKSHLLYFGSELSCDILVRKICGLYLQLEEGEVFVLIKDNRHA